MTVRRHPIRGLLGGLLLGIGIALVLMLTGTALLGEYTVIATVLLFAVVGLGVALAWPARGRPAA